MGACPSWPVTGAGSEIMVFATGLTAGVVAQPSYTHEIPSLCDTELGWQVFFKYRRNGITRADFERKALLQLGECDE